jgi:Zn-dependent protease with chaperone function
MNGLPGLVVLPVAGALLGSAGAWLLPNRMRPAVATRIVTALVVLSAVAVVWSLVLVTLATTIEIHGIAERVQWCNDYLQTHSDRPSLVGALSAIFLAASVVAGARVARRHRRLRAHGSDGGIAVMPSPIPTAFALPGRPGQIVVSQGMLQLLDGDERRALLAHERAHLDLHHHRYLRAAELAGAFLPILRPLVIRVRLATERWADEEAATRIGDRHLVARALARASLAQPQLNFGMLGMSDSGVVARVEALLEPPLAARRFVESAYAIAASCTALLLVLSVEQVHHWFVFAFRLCWL